MTYMYTQLLTLLTLLHRTRKHMAILYIKQGSGWNWLYSIATNQHCNVIIINIIYVCYDMFNVTLHTAIIIIIIYYRHILLSRFLIIMII